MFHNSRESVIRKVLSERKISLNYMSKIVGEKHEMLYGEMCGGGALSGAHTGFMPASSILAVLKNMPCK